MTEPSIEEYRQLAKDLGDMRLYGYTSTSRNKLQAEKFAFSNENSGIKKVVYHIHWESAEEHYFMNNGANDHEEEILLMDGASFEVLSVFDEEYELFEIYGFTGQSSIYNGLKGIITNKKVDRRGKVRFYVPEGDFSNTTIDFSPDNLRSLGKKKNSDHLG